MDDNTTTGVQETEGTPKDQYSIYNYLKGNPASIATVFTVLIAIVTFLAQVMTYMTNKKTLVYWGFDGSYATLGTEGLLYSAIASIIQIIVQTFAAVWYAQTCEVYFENKQFYTPILHKYQSEKTKIKELIKKIKKLSKTKYQDGQKDAELSSIQNELNTLNNYLNESMTILKNWKKDTILLFFINVIPVILLLIYFSLLGMFLNDGKATFDRIVTLLIIHGATLWLLFVIQEKTVLNKQKAKQETQENQSNVQIQFMDTKADYPLFTLLRKWKGIPNSIIISYCIPLCVSIFLLVNPYTSGNPSATTNKDSFQIVSIDDAYYAVVYRENDLYFLEKAVVTDDTITIYTNEQRILTLEDASFTVYTFKKENVSKTESEVLP